VDKGDDSLYRKIQEWDHKLHIQVVQTREFLMSWTYRKWVSQWYKL
jgi:hypothetical protein